MMDSISGITPVHVISNYTRTVNTGDSIQISQIRHTDDGKTTKVEQVIYTTYNKDGTTQAASATGSKVDITA